MKLLDSSVLVDLDRGGPEIEAKAAKLDQEGKHAISAVTVTELFYGVEKAYQDNPQAHTQALGKLETLTSRFEIAPITRTVAVQAAQQMAPLRAEGNMLTDLHDVYIAATALTNQLVLLTANNSDFDRIDNLTVEDWTTY